MNEEERLVAIVSPWDNLGKLVKRGFRVQSLPREKKVLVWRVDLQGEADLTQAIREAGISAIEIRRGKVVVQWDG